MEGLYFRKFKKPLEIILMTFLCLYHTCILIISYFYKKIIWYNSMIFFDVGSKLKIGHYGLMLFQNIRLIPIAN